MEQENHPVPQGGEEKKRRWLPLLLLLLVLALITSCVAGFVLGRSVGPVPKGQIVDTILLEPDSPAPALFHLSGKVLYTDGSPAAGRTLQLHSEPITAVSGADGSFLFANVAPGEHTVSVLGENGAVQAQRRLNVLRDSAARAVKVDLAEDGAYVLTLSVDVRVLEINVELDSAALSLDVERFSYATRDGTVTTPGGTASLRDGVIVTPGGNVYLPDGTVVFPGASKQDPTYLLRPDDTLVANQPFSGEAANVAADGTVTLPDGTVIEPGGGIRRPDGTASRPGDTGVLIDNQTVTPIGARPQQTASSPAEGAGTASRPVHSSAPQPVTPNVPPASSESAQPPDSSSSSGDASSDSSSSTPDSSSSGSSSSDSSSSVPDSSSSGSSSSVPDSSSSSGGSSSESGSSSSSSSASSSSSEPEDDDPGVLSAEGQQAGGAYTQWTQGYAVDLFYHRTEGMADKIAPGSAGFYCFRLQNSRRGDVAVSVVLTEGGGLHVPLAFTLTPLDAQGGKLAGQSVSGSLQADGQLSLDTVVAAGSTADYRLDWQWPLTGNDAADTQAGSAQDLTYLLNLTLHAEDRG